MLTIRVFATGVQSSVSFIIVVYVFSFTSQAAYIQSSNGGHYYWCSRIRRKTVVNFTKRRTVLLSHITDEIVQRATGAF